MATINPYLSFMGNTEEAFNFYKSVFGGEFTGIQRFKDIPEGDKMSAEDQEKIMHVALPIGGGNVLMGTDTLESMGHSLTVGTNISLSISADSKEEEILEAKVSTRKHKIKRKPDADLDIGLT